MLGGLSLAYLHRKRSGFVQNPSVRIGIFDSGLGGLAIAQSIIRRLPQYDYLYLGDTKRVPYGGRSQETIHEFVAEALGHLFAEDCQLIVLACNTASAEALRKSQQEYLPRHFPDRRILGVIIPTAEAALSMGSMTIGVLATRSTVESGAYPRELKRQRDSVEIVQIAAPLLVPLVENDGVRYLGPVLDDYLAELTESAPQDRAGLVDEPARNNGEGRGLDAIILGCTHYCLIKDQVRQRVRVPVLSQDEIVPEKTADYLRRHPEIEAKLGRSGARSYRVTDLGPGYNDLARRMAGEHVDLELVTI